MTAPAIKSRWELKADPSIICTVISVGENPGGDTIVTFSTPGRPADCMSRSLFLSIYRPHVDLPEVGSVWEYVHDGNIRRIVRAVFETDDKWWVVSSGGTEPIARSLDAWHRDWKQVAQ